jgi:ATP-binding protein involved in chromosome partitioning
MFEKVNVPVLGIVENMSGFVDPESGKRFDLFSSGGGRRLAAELGVPLLGEVPLQPGLAARADQGEPIVAAEPESPAAKALAAVTAAVLREAAQRRMQLPVIQG